MAKASEKTAIAVQEMNTPQLNPDTVVRYLVRGNGKVTEQEVVMFIELCKTQGLNPFIGDAYLIKYGDAPASIITGKEVFTKRAAKNERFEGMQAGVIVLSSRDGKTPIEREGSMVLTDIGEKLVGGWAKVYVKGYCQPVYASVSFKEYTTGKSTWNKMPGVMIRKCALVAALREAFPEEFQGLYCAEEMSQAQRNVDVVEVTENAAPIQQEKPTQPTKANELSVVTLINEQQVYGLAAACMEHGIDKAKLCELYNVHRIEELDTDQLDHIRSNFSAIKHQLAGGNV